MEKRSSIAVSLTAIVSSLLTLGCCIPLGFLGAASAAGAAALIAPARPWLLGLSVVLLGTGFFQVYRGARCGIRQSRFSMIALSLAAVFVLFLILFPQLVAGFLANHLSGGGAQ
jgi:hypothetical protein